MSNKIYRVLDEESGTYISKVAGFIRSEKYTNVDSAYVYSKEQATKIVKLMNYMRTHMLKEENLPLGLEENLRNQTLAIIEVELKDVKLSLEEIARALESAKAKKIPEEQAFRNAQWERIRRYHDYFDYDISTPSHQYIYLAKLCYNSDILFNSLILNSIFPLLKDPGIILVHGSFLSI